MEPKSCSRIRHEQGLVLGNFIGFVTSKKVMGVALLGKDSC